MEHYLIYVSKADHLMVETELLDILKKSRLWNTDHGITGMLIYIEGIFAHTQNRKIVSEPQGRFMQVLEGQFDEVDRVFEMIQSDSRHHDLTILQRTDTSVRNFENWKMGFKSLSLDDYQHLPGFFDLNPSFLSSTELQSSNRPLQFLKSFYHRGTQEFTLFSS